MSKTTGKSHNHTILADSRGICRFHFDIAPGIETARYLGRSSTQNPDLSRLVLGAMMRRADAARAGRPGEKQGWNALLQGYMAHSANGNAQTDGSPA